MSFDTYGVSAEQLTKLTGCTLTTAIRWKRTGKVPRYAARLLRVLLDGELGELNRDWSGWTLNKNGLCAPTGDRPYQPGHVMIAGLRDQQISALRVELAKLKTDTARCEHCAHCMRAEQKRGTA